MLHANHSETAWNGGVQRPNSQSAIRNPLLCCGLRPRYGALLCLLLLAGAALAQRVGRREMGLLAEPKGCLMGWDGGELLTLPPTGELTVQKARPADCQVVLGFSHAPIDGRIDTLYHGIVNEYNNSQNYRVNAWVLNPLYEFVRDPMVRVRLADAAGFNYMLIRGGFIGSIYRDADSPMGPGNGRLIAELTEREVSANPQGVAHYKVWRLHFPEAVKTDWIGFLRKSNLLADVSFYRVGDAATPRSYAGSTVLRIGEAIPDPVAIPPSAGPPRVPSARPRSDDTKTAVFSTPYGLDFARLPCVVPGRQHVSTFERRFFRPGDREVRRLVPDEAGGTAISLRPEQQIHFLTDPLPAGAAIGAVRFDLGLRGVSPRNCVTLAVQDPLIGGREIMRFDARVGKAERTRLLFDFPAQIVAEGRRFWITFASQEGGQLLADSRISLLAVAPDVAREEYLASRMLLLRGNFSALSEGRSWKHTGGSVKWLRQYDGSRWSIQKNRPHLIELYSMLEHMVSLAPDDPILTGQYYPWLVRSRKTPYQPPALPDIEGVPRWAQLMDRAARWVAEIPKWWIRNRMAPSGELGGAYNDDTCMVADWTPSILMDSEGFAPIARHCMMLMSAGVLQHTLYAGVNRSLTDPLHAYEEGMNLMSQMPLVFYGDPRYIEWLMTSIRTCDKWMYRTPQGSLKWRVSRFGWRTAKNPPKEIPPNVSGDADLMLNPHLTLAWYNGNPNAIQRIVDYTEGMPDPYRPRAYNGGGSVHIAAYWFTGDPKHLHFPKKTAKGDYAYGDLWAWFKRQPDATALAPEAREQPWWPQWERFYRNRADSRGDMAWAVRPDRGVLAKSLEHVLWGLPEAAGVERFFYMKTMAQPFTDRVSLPVAPLAQAMLGGYTLRNKFWPAYALSYEGLGGDFAAIVLDHGRDRLKVVMINLREGPREGAFRVWQLDHGRYELKVGPDLNDDGELDSVESVRTLELARMDAVPVNLPPRRLTVYELRLVEKLDDLYTRADLAMSVEDVVQEDGKLKLTVHNIGGRAARDILVAAVDGSGKVLETATIAELEAPLDLLPKVATLELPAANAANILIDPEVRIPEITRLNNAVPVGSFEIPRAVRP